MYGSSYTHVPRYTLEAQKKKQLQRSKGKSCGYYMRIIFFFSSLIQSLIIVSLVLFLVYGKKQDSADSGRIADLEQSFSRLSLENVALNLQRKNLTRSLNVSSTEKLQLEQDVLKMRNLTNISAHYIQFFRLELDQCNADKLKMAPPPGGVSCPGLRRGMEPPAECRSQLEHQKAKEQLLQSQLNQTVLENRIMRDKLTKERDDISLEAIDLRNHKQRLEWEIEKYQLQCKRDFVASLSGISNVSKAFLGKIDSLFSHHMPFQLSCNKQREHLGQLCSNCTTLSRQVEYRFQQYLDDLSTKVNDCVGKTSRLQADNDMKTKKYDSCNHNRTAMAHAHQQDLQRVQLRCDQNTKKLLLEKDRVNQDKTLLDKKLHVRETEIVTLKEENKQLNASCVTRPPVRPDFRVPGFPFLDPQRGVSTPWLNKPAVSGTNGGVNPGYTGSTGRAQGSRAMGGWATGRFVGTSPVQGGGASNTVPGNPGSGNPGSGNPGLRNPGSGNPGSGNPGSGNPGSGNPGSGSPFFGGSNLGRGTGTAGSYGGLGGRRTAGLEVNIEQHLQELQRFLLKPSSTEKKNESPSRPQEKRT